MLKTVIVTTTFYKSVDELRFRLACDMVKAAVADDHIVVVVDGSPIPEVAETLKSLGANVFPQLHNGMGAGRREAFFHAVEIGEKEGVYHFLWTEPEKVDLIRFVGTIMLCLDETGAMIVIPKRSEIAWSSWPTFQRESEEKANEVYNEVFGSEGFDPMFGPVAFHIHASVVFIRAYCPPTAYENMVPDTYIQHYAPILLAGVDREVTIAYVTIDMQYPSEQRAEEEGSANKAILEKRKMQLETLTNAYRALAKVNGKVYSRLTALV